MPDGPAHYLDSATQWMNLILYTLKIPQAMRDFQGMISGS